MSILTRIVVSAAAFTALFAVPAGAAVTASQVTTPAGATSYDLDLDHPGTIRVAGTATAGDPATDLSLAWMLLPAADHDRFRAAYAEAGRGPVTDATWARACAISPAAMALITW